ncbi:MAG: AraC family transcriptional regulator [Bacillota bacterium]|nr:AraC family transcriptional regulator [Bacillota bacterium]
MNYYERVQRALDYIEEGLTEPISIDEAAKAAYMSISNFYRMFYALVGYTVKDYIRARRLYCSARQLQETDKRIIDIALEYQFESQEAFTRAFKGYFKVTPGKFRTLNNNLRITERVNLMEKYFETNINEDKYPDIKVLKELEPMRVAYFHIICENPEVTAIEAVLSWAKKNNLLDDNNHRFFGFDNDGPNGEHGYEFWMTVGEEVQGDEKIKIKEFKGGKYAVTNTSLEDITITWKRLTSWLELSQYEYGDSQWLEEHLISDDELRSKAADKIADTFRTDRIDIYMPIK